MNNEAVLETKKSKGIRWDESTMEEAMAKTLDSLEREDSIPIKGPLKMLDSLEVTKARMQRKAQGGYISSSEEEEEEDDDFSMGTEVRLGITDPLSRMDEGGSGRALLRRHVSFQVGGRVKPSGPSRLGKGVSFAHGPRKEGDPGLGSVRFQIPKKDKELPSRPTMIDE